MQQYLIKQYNFISFYKYQVLAVLVHFARNTFPAETKKFASYKKKHAMDLLTGARF